jgi:protein gp37
VEGPAGGAHPRRLSASGRDPQTGRIRRARSEDGEWFEGSWNPTAGCSVCSPGCENCYAMRIAARLGRMSGKTGARYSELTTMTRSGPLWTGELRVAEDLLAWPLSQRQPRRIAVNRMSDLFHENLATETVDLLHAIMAAAHWHQFLVLTKRSRRMQAYYSDLETPYRVREKFAVLSSVVSPVATHRRASSRRRANPAIGSAQLASWPLPNLWLGVSVEDQDRIARVVDLLQIPSAIRRVCFEPLLDRVRPEAVPVGGRYFDAFGGRHYAINSCDRKYSVAGPAWRPLDWVVIGGEIGTRARTMQPDWVRNLRDKCLAAGIPLFFRRWGEWAPASESRSGEMIRAWRRAAGRVLDGRTWDELPLNREA